MIDFALERVEPLFSGHLFGVERRHLLADGSPFTREVVTHPGAVAVVALDELDRVVLVHQYRAPAGERLLEIPAGTLDVAGEASIEAARRELQEETGFEATSWELLGEYFNSPGYSTQLTTIYLARQLVERSASPDGVEEVDIQIERWPLDEALEMMHTGEIRCAITSLGMALAAQRLDG